MFPSLSPYLYEGKAGFLLVLEDAAARVNRLGGFQRWEKNRHKNAGVKPNFRRQKFFRPPARGVCCLLFFRLTLDDLHNR